MRSLAVVSEECFCEIEFDLLMNDFKYAVNKS